DVSIDSLLTLNVRIATAGHITVNTVSPTSLSLGFQGAMLDPTTLETFVIANGLINLNNSLPTPDYVAGAVDFDFGGEWYSAAGNFNPIQDPDGAGGITTTSGDTISYSFMTYRLNNTENYDILGMTILNTEEMTSGSVPFVQPGTVDFPQANMFFVRNASFADLFMLISNPAVETLDSLSTTEIYLATSGEVTFTRTPAVWEGIFSAQMFPLGVTPVLVPLQNGSFSLTSEPYVSIREMPVHHQPFDMTLKPAYPNPFNPTVHIPFSLNQQESVELAIYDLNGRLVTTLVRGDMETGGHIIQWQPVNQSSGIYLVRLTAGTEIQTQKIIYLK
ncbi:MAG: T9SS type A sorting domain-containing protein, partial [Candidatus Marinimicrobia bacterium]|nr:T9SS type A sorting domain-containing protein [Candidatus Neomarinimicrobiota bacterium]MCF7840726.1 T9SS type A sorting domain-containing protein [Candidatus Neomarinimicrobiota bacterium]